MNQHSTATRSLSLAASRPIRMAIGALVGGIAIAMVTAWLTGLLSFYHGASPLYSSIVTLALPIVLVQIIFSGGRFTGSSSGLSGFPTYYWKINTWFWIAGVFLVLVSSIAWLFVRSTGRKRVRPSRA